MIQCEFNIGNNEDNIEKNQGQPKRVKYSFKDF